MNWNKCAAFAILCSVSEKGDNMNDVPQPDKDIQWQETYDARQSYFQSAFGRLPDDILKMLNLSGYWPGGGLFVIPFEKYEGQQQLAVYTSFGLSNIDMPVSTKTDGLEKNTGLSGYGYEITIIAKKEEKWPLAILQWILNAEILNAVGILRRVEANDGLTVESIKSKGGLHPPINLLIAKALPPLPQGTELPNGRMHILVATAITDSEVKWAREHSTKRLLELLQEKNVGQISDLNRAGVV